MQGKVAGLMINGTGSGVNPNFRIILRGQRSLTGNNQALIVLDNVIVPNEVLGNLNPNDVEDVTVLNGAGAAALYGSQASNGAIIVTTKKEEMVKLQLHCHIPQLLKVLLTFRNFRRSSGQVGHLTVTMSSVK